MCCPVSVFVPYLRRRRCGGGSVAGCLQRTVAASRLAHAGQEHAERQRQPVPEHSLVSGACLLCACCGVVVALAHRGDVHRRCGLLPRQVLRKQRTRRLLACAELRFAASSRSARIRSSRQRALPVVVTITQHCQGYLEKGCSHWRLRCKLAMQACPTGRVAPRACSRDRHRRRRMCWGS